MSIPKLPRAPAVPRGVQQVGLGTARNFTTGRPIFAHLAENVPVAGRALSEADWKIQRKKEQARLAKANAKKEQKKKVKAEKASPGESIFFIYVFIYLVVWSLAARMQEAAE